MRFDWVCARRKISCKCENMMDTLIYAGVNIAMVVLPHWELSQDAKVKIKQINIMSSMSYITKQDTMSVWTRLLLGTTLSNRPLELENK